MLQLFDQFFMRLKYSASISKSFRRVLFIFILSGLLLLVLGILSFLQLQQTFQYTNDIERNHRVILTTERILSNLKDMETGQRGYLISKRFSYLTPYFEAYSKLGHNLNVLEKMITKNPVQFQRLNKMKILIKQAVTIMEEDRQRTRNKEEVGIERLELGKVKMDQIRIIVSQFIETEKSYLDRKYSLKLNSYKRLPAYLLLLSFITGFLFLYAFVYLIMELSKRIELQHDLENKIIELKRSNQELEQFAYVASHDLQEPLRKINSFGDMLKMRHNNVLNEEGKQLVDKITRSAQRMKELIEDLLVYSRTAKSNENTFESVDLNEVIASITNDLSLAIEEKKAALVIDDLPTITGNALQMKQLFQNLLSNALKFSKEATPPQIEIRYAECEAIHLPIIPSTTLYTDFHQIEIRDNGIGFDNEFADKIFVIFQRLHNQNIYKGTGIGLAICKKVVEIHGGYITAWSKLNEGSTFSIYLPKS